MMVAAMRFETTNLIGKFAATIFKTRTAKLLRAPQVVSMLSGVNFAEALLQMS